MWQVYFKELLELTRDKKTLIFTIMLPTLILPVLFAGFIFLALNITSKAIEEDLKYAVVGGEHYPEIVEELALNDKFIFVETNDTSDIKEMINTNKIRFAVVIPENSYAKNQNNEGVKIEMLYNASGSTSVILFKRVSDSLSKLEKSKIDLRYVELGLTEQQGKAINDPIDLVQKSTADKRESFGEVIGGMLPYMLILLGFSGAMYPALDLGVGEKERGTLETLLLTPVTRFQLVFAKFLVIFSTSFISVFLSLLSFGIVSTIVGSLALDNVPAKLSAKFGSIAEVLSSISMLDVGLMFLMLVPVAGIFASLMLSVSIYARTFKEAQNYMSPLMIAIIFPLMIPMLPGVKLDWIWASVPITNISLAIKEIFKGTIDMSMLGVIFLSTTIIAGLLLALCNWWFQREQVLFRN